MRRRGKDGDQGTAWCCRFTAEVVRLEGVFAPTENDGQTLALARRLWWSYSLGFRPDEDATVWLLEMQLEEAQLKRQPPLPRTARAAVRHSPAGATPATRLPTTLFL